MRSSWEFKFSLQTLLELQISLVPVLVTYLLFDTPAILRRLTQKAYVPIYFVVFPLGHSDALYAQYFNEDYLYQTGTALSAKEREALRTKIKVQAVYAMAFVVPPVGPVGQARNVALVN